jgi:integrase
MQDTESRNESDTNLEEPCQEIGNFATNTPGFSSKQGVLKEGNKASRGKTTLPKVLTYDEIDRLLLSFDDIEDLAACRIMLFAGLRVEEASSLTIDDIDRERRALFVRQGKGAKDRWAPCDVATISLALCYAKLTRRKGHEHLFIKTTRTLQRHIEDAYRKAGITWGASCHTLRHTCATWQLDKGIPLEVVRENLGHEDITTTQIYLHLNIRQRSRTYLDASRFGV